MNILHQMIQKRKIPHLKLTITPILNRILIILLYHFYQQPRLSHITALHLLQIHLQLLLPPLSRPIQKLFDTVCDELLGFLVVLLLAMLDLS